MKRINSKKSTLTLNFPKLPPIPLIPAYSLNPLETLQSKHSTSGQLPSPISNKQLFYCIFIFIYCFLLFFVGFLWTDNNIFSKSFRAFWDMDVQWNSNLWTARGKVAFLCDGPWDIFLLLVNSHNSLNPYHDMIK